MLLLMVRQCADYFTEMDKKIVQTAKQRCVEYRAGFMADVFAYKKEMLVFIDETESDR